METMFQNHSYPFYRFGDIIYLQKISEEDWVKFIRSAIGMVSTAEDYRYMSFPSGMLR